MDPEFDRVDLEEERDDSPSFLPEERVERFGGPQDEEEEDEEGEGEGEAEAGGGDEQDDEDRRKQEERERKKAEVRKRLEEASKQKKAKKGFLTPERKKKLRKLLMQKAADDLKQQQLLKEQERQRILQERIIPLPDVDKISAQAELEKIAKQMWDRVYALEESKYDIDYEVRQKDFEINELAIAVNDLRGKFVKPTLKKVSKYDNKFKKMKAQNEENKKVDFRANLKSVKKDTFGLEDLKLDEPKKKEEAPAEAAPAAEAPAESAPEPAAEVEAEA